jgi:hypothetical protein
VHTHPLKGAGTTGARCRFITVVWNGSFTESAACIKVNQYRLAEGAMSFKKNLQKKIEIDGLAAKVIASIGPPESGRKMDKEAMRSLLDIAGHTLRKERDLDLYLEDAAATRGHILVLDNDLTIYDTTVEDVVIRKSPYLKDMISIRNIVKILNDKDVVVSKKDASVRHVQLACIAKLDLSHDTSDIADIAIDGVASMESNYSDGVIEVLDMFAELLGYKPPPKIFSLRHHHVRGALEDKGNGEQLFGPTVLYSLAGNTVKVIDVAISSGDKDRVQYYKNIASDEEKAPFNGEAAFKFLKEAVLRSEPVITADK